MEKIIINKLKIKHDQMRNVCIILGLYYSM